MRKIHKITNIALIFMLIRVVVCDNALCANPLSKDSLRVPIGQKKLYGRMGDINGGTYRSLSIEKWKYMTAEERILALTPLVRIIALGRMPGKTMPYYALSRPEIVEDMELAGNEALWNAINENKFDPEKSFKPSSLFAKVIYNAMLNELDKFTRYERGVSSYMLKKHRENGEEGPGRYVHLEAFAGFSDRGNEAAAEWPILESPKAMLDYKLDKIQRLMRFLTPKEQPAFILYFYGGLTGQQIADKFGVTRKEISRRLVRAREKIREKKIAKDLLRKLAETNSDLDLSDAIVEHFSRIIEKEENRIKPKGPNGNGNKKIQHLSLVVIKEGDASRLAEVCGVARILEVEELFREYREFVVRLKSIGITDGFNSYLNTVSAYISEAQESIREQRPFSTENIQKKLGLAVNSVRINLRKTLEKRKHRVMESAFLTHSTGAKGMSLEVIKEEEMSRFLKFFPVDERNLPEIIAQYIAHVRLMERLGISKGRTVSENIMSAFTKLVREKNRGITRKELARKGLFYDTDLYKYLQILRKRLKKDSGWTDIFAASKKEDEVFKKVFLEEMLPLKLLKGQLFYLDDYGKDARIGI